MVQELWLVEKKQVCQPQQKEFWQDSCLDSAHGCHQTSGGHRTPLRPLCQKLQAIMVCPWDISL